MNKQPPINSQPLNSQNIDISWIHKDAKCWVYFPQSQTNNIYLRGTVTKINLLNFNKGNSIVRGILQNGQEFQTKASLLERSRQSRSIERDLIEMDIINGAEVLNQLKRRFEERKIHVYLWNSLIIINPFQFIAKNYGDKMLHYYYQHIFLKEDLSPNSLLHVEPHIYAFMFNIMKEMRQSNLTQVLSISGQSGSGKTQTNKQCLRVISYCCQKQKLKSQTHLSDNNLQLKILQCDPILQAFGNAKTVKNDNSSRFGKLISIKIDSQSMSIEKSSIKNYFLQKSRIISQSSNQRNFHIFYLFLKFMPQQQRSTIYKLKSRLSHPLKFEDFNYISQKHSFSNNILISQKQMWNQLLESFKILNFNKDVIHQIWSIISSVLLLGNIAFDGTLQNENDPCQIINDDILINISYLLKIKKQQLHNGLVFNKKTIANQLMFIPLTSKQCQEGRDSMAKAIYQGLFTWIVQQLNNRVNNNSSLQQLAQQQPQLTKQIKLLDIYGFQVFEKNSFQQLCVNYTNQKIHQIYLQHVFIHQKKILKLQGLQSIIPKLNFTDNSLIIQLLDTSIRSIYNLLDQSCTLNVKDIDFLTNIRKTHELNQNFPSSNKINIRNSFIIKHTPCDIEYMVDGFRDKNKDLLRQDIIVKLSQSEGYILSKIFSSRISQQKPQSTSSSNNNSPSAKYLGIKIRKQVKQLIQQMSTHTNLHFVRCIKPNQQKKSFNFIDRVCYNQIKYLGILDTIQMRKQSYHVRIGYREFYQKFGILDTQGGGLKRLVELQAKDVRGGGKANQFREYTMKLMTSNVFTNHKLQYLFGKDRIFMKMSTKNFIDAILKQKTKNIQYSTTIIKASFRCYKKNKLKFTYNKYVPKIQDAIRNFLIIAKLSKKKNAVLTIQKYWIKYCYQYFLRKRRNHVIVLQKYIKRSVQMQKQQILAQNMLKIKTFIRSALKTHTQAATHQNYLRIRSIITSNIFQKSWNYIIQAKRMQIKYYLKAFTTRKLNGKLLYHSQRSAKLRQSLRYIHTLQKYAKGFLIRQKVQGRLQNVKKIQNYIRMRGIRQYFTNLKSTAIKIQRAWRRYYEFKQRSILQTQNYFESRMLQQKNKVNRCLWRQLQQHPYDTSSALYNPTTTTTPTNAKLSSYYNQPPQHSIQQILYQQQKVKRDKIGLFYYLLDFQILCPLQYIYPQKTWIDNYYKLFKQSIEKNNPIQYLDVSGEHTIATTINKIYQWGEIREEEGIRTVKYYQNVPTPNSRINKVKACNGFTLIQTQQPQQLLIMGDQKKYQQSSIKQWSTLKQSFILLNGIILTLKNNTLTKLLISQKVTQLSCGMMHTICKTSLKKVYTWGQNKMGQLGLGHFSRCLVPQLVLFFNKNKTTIMQIGTTAYGTVVLDNNCKIWWFGKNGTINNQPIPRQVFLPLKSDFIDNSKKYSVIRILPKWSKSISLIGLTVAIYDGAFKSTQTAIRKKCLENLMAKWSQQDLDTINPPYIASLSSNFSEKHMYFKKPVNNSNGVTSKRNQGIQGTLSYQKVKNKLLNEMMMIQHAEKKLLLTMREQLYGGKMSAYDK